MSNVSVIGIAGGSGSGKTMLTNRIASQFQEHMTVLKHDNYYKAHDDVSFTIIPEGGYNQIGMGMLQNYILRHLRNEI